MPGFVSHERLALGPWAALERALARLLEHAGFAGVMLVGGSGDLGADVVGTFGGKDWLLQSKYRGSGTVGSSALREAVQAMTAYGANVCVAATNQWFNEDAYQHWNALQSAGIEAYLWNGRSLLEHFGKLPSESVARRPLRQYQGNAVDAVESKRSQGSRAALVVMATGLGKSVVAGELIANELFRNPDGEVLMLAHTVDLVKQLERSLWPTLRKEISTHLWAEGELPSYAGGVTCATWQTVVGAVAREDLAGRYAVVVVDEAHHAPAPVYRSLIEALKPNFLIGLTATPWRGDEHNLSDIFGQPAFTMDIVDGMQGGYLADVDYRMLVDDIDWDEIQTMSRSGYSIRDLNTKLILPDRDEAMVARVIERMRDLGDARVMCFCRTIDHAERIQRLFQARDVQAGVLHSRLRREERFRTLSNFRNGSLRLVLSVDMLNEGIDVPDVNMVVFMRVTHSRRIFVQQLGRGLRVTPTKNRVVVLDFVADVRRIAAGIELNREARRRAEGVEVLRFEEGDIVRFDSDSPTTFFDEYLRDVASIEDLDESAKLIFPSVSSEHF